MTTLAENDYYYWIQRRKSIEKIFANFGEKGFALLVHKEQNQYNYKTFLFSASLSLSPLFSSSLVILLLFSHYVPLSNFSVFLSSQSVIQLFRYSIYSIALSCT